MKTFIISDTHFHDPKLQEKEPARKKFPNSIVLDACMESNWNHTVGQDDLIIHLGDVSFGPIEPSQELIKRLHGRKILVRGNHDRGVEAMLNMGFITVFESLTIWVHGKLMLLQHKPYYDKLPNGIYGVIHGHIHTGSPEGLKRANENPDIPAYNLNACVEKTAFKPILIEDAIGRLNNQLKAAGQWPWSLETK